MIEIGKKQKLIVAKTVDFGVYLAEDKNAGQEDRVLLHHFDSFQALSRLIKIVNLEIRKMREKPCEN